MRIFNRATASDAGVAAGTVATAELSPLDAALASIRMPARLQLAEHNLTATRRQREEVASRHRAACQKAHQAGPTKSADAQDIEPLSRELAAIDEKLGAERREL